MPLIVLVGGVGLMRALPHYERVESRMALPRSDYQPPLQQRWRGYEVWDVQRYWERLKRFENQLWAERFLLQVDLLFPLLYGSALALSLLVASHALAWPVRPWLLLIPVAVAVAADWTENLTLLGQLRRFENNKSLSVDLIQLASTATTIKFAAIGASTLMCLTLAGCLVYRHFKTAS